MAGFSTRAIKAATTSPRVTQSPSSVPIYQAAAFATEDAAELGDVLTGAVPGYAYSRIDNPTTAALGTAVAELEGAEAGLAFATGMAAIHAAILSVVRAGQTIVATQAVYGTTRDLLTRILSGLGIATEFVDPRDLAAVEAALTRTGAPILYVETVSNPTIVVSDLAALAAVAHRHGALLLVDNTFASPYACRPIELGADLVMHSATKYLSGHGDVLAGVVVGSHERISAVRPILVDAGGALAPLAAFLVLRGLPTLAIRMERHTETALELAAWLTGQDGVERVHYPGLPSDPSHEVAVRQLDVFGGMLAFELTGGREAGPGVPGRHGRGRANGIAGRGANHHNGSRPPLLTVSWTRLRCARRESRPDCCAARWAWKTWRISAPISSWGWPRPGPRLRRRRGARPGAAQRGAAGRCGAGLRAVGRGAGPWPLRRRAAGRWARRGAVRGGAAGRCGAGLRAVRRRAVGRGAGRGPSGAARGAGPLGAARVPSGAAPGRGALSRFTPNRHAAIAPTASRPMPRSSPASERSKRGSRAVGGAPEPGSFAA